jgi:hypothetical protein
MRYILTPILVVFISTLSNSQDNLKGLHLQENKKDSIIFSRTDKNSILSKAYPTLKIGYMYSKWNSAELGFAMLNLIGKPSDFYGSMGFALGSDFVFDNKVIFGPKISAEAYIVILGARINAKYYTSDFSSGSFKLQPEIGLTVGGFFNLFYGYTFNISNSTFYKQKNSISLSSNIYLLPRSEKRRRYK